MVDDTVPGYSEIGALRDLLASGRLSCEGAVRCFVESAGQENSVLNAITSMDPEGVLALAKERDRSTDLKAELLGGVPFVSKEIENVAGWVTSNASLAQRNDQPAAFNDVPIGKLLEAGAIMAGRSNAPEYAFEVYTSSRMFGPCRNPWNLTISPGGSSGGAAAALAAGIVPLATGTDGGGSVRIPAALCGVVGLKVTRGMIARWPPHAWPDLSSSGVLAKTPADTRLLLGMLQGEVAGDIYWPIRRRDTGSRLPMRWLAVDRFVNWGPLDGAVKHAFDRSIEMLMSGIVTSDVERADHLFEVEPTNPDDDWFTLTTVEQAEYLGRSFIKQHRDEFGKAMLGYLEKGLQCSAVDYSAARRRIYTYSRVLDEWFERGYFILSPTVTVKGFDPAEPSDGSGVAPAVVNTVLQNMTGHPAISIPCGVIDEGGCFGLQITGPRGSDRELINLADRMWNVSPWRMSAPGYESFIERVDAYRE